MRSMRSPDLHSPATFIVAGLLYGPEAERGRYEAVSWGVLAGYLFGAFLLVLANRHERSRS